MENQPSNRQWHFNCPWCRSEMTRSHRPSQNCPKCRETEYYTAYNFNLYSPHRPNVSHTLPPVENTSLCRFHEQMVAHEFGRRREEQEMAFRIRPEVPASESPFLRRTIPGRRSLPFSPDVHRSHLSNPLNSAPAQAYSHHPHPVTKNISLNSTLGNIALPSRFSIDRTGLNPRIDRGNAPRPLVILPRNRRDVRSLDRPQTGERLRASTGVLTNPSLRSPPSETTRRLHTRPERHPERSAQSTIPTQPSPSAPPPSSQPSRDSSQTSSASSAVSTVSTSSYASSVSQRSYASDTTIRPPPTRTR